MEILFNIFKNSSLFNDVKSQRWDVNLYCLCFQGGIVFVAVKGAMNIFYKQQQFNRQSYRIIGDFNGDDRPPSTASTSSASETSSAREW